MLDHLCNALAPLCNACAFSLNAQLPPAAGYQARRAPVIRGPASHYAAASSINKNEKT
jgi:hypothetical protein